jgi:tetratricopeptide (TPR) repeat protein
MPRTHTLRRRLAGAACAAAAAAAAACNDFLEVANPAQAEIAQIADSSNALLLVNGALREMANMVSQSALYGAVLSDEARAFHTNASYAPIDLRNFNNASDIIGQIYPFIQRARFAGDTVADRIRGWRGEASARDLQYARMRAVAGYGYVMLAENFCRAPIGGGPSVEPPEMLRSALTRFDEAVAAARAARGAATTAGGRTSADSVWGLALVGAARAALNLGERQRAAAYAQQAIDSIPAGFDYRVYFAEGIPTTPGLPVNPFWNVMGSPQPAANPSTVTTSTTGGFTYLGGALWLGVDTTFQALNDPRVPQTPTRVIPMTGGTARVVVANKPRSFGGFVYDTARFAGVAMTPGASMRVASTIEARYILAETQAAAGNTAPALAFVRSQQQANRQPLTADASQAGVLAALRDQKRREFYLDGHRLGELRRYKAQYQVDQFTAGQGFGAVECFPIPTSETNSNPQATI